jgi:hypothetical protein
LYLTTSSLLIVNVITASSASLCKCRSGKSDSTEEVFTLFMFSCLPRPPLDSSVLSAIDFCSVQVNEQILTTTMRMKRVERGENYSDYLRLPFIASSHQPRTLSKLIRAISARPLISICFPFNFTNFLINTLWLPAPLTGAFYMRWKMNSSTIASRDFS